MGYHRAGFDVVGVDIVDQPSYPFEFHRADAMRILQGLIEGELFYPRWLNRPPDVIHASPPCQFKTQMAAAHRSRGFDHRPNLLTPTRELLRKLGKPYVLENVPGARKYMTPTLVLHGGMFGLGVHRPRVFECSELILAPRTRMTRKPIGVYGDRPHGKFSTRLNGDMSGKRSEFRVARTLEEARELMGMPWADWHGCKEAVPPAYTEFIGHQLIEHVMRNAA
jgi:DNA (cytosine-5)-methyltransferase 1